MGEFVLIDPLGVSHSYNASKVGFAPVSGSDKVIFAEGGSGGENYFGSYLRHELTEYEDSTVTRLFTSAIVSQPNLKSLSFPNLLRIDHYGITGVSALTDVYFPELRYVSEGGLQVSLSSGTVFPKCSYVGSSAIGGGFSSNGIRYVGDIAYKATGNWSSSVCQLLPSTRVIGGYCFYSKSIREIQGVESVQDINDGAFFSVKLLSEASFPNCKRVWNFGFESGAFEGCESLRSAYFPECSQIGKYAFAGCTSLKSAYFPKCTSIESYAFNGCKSLSDATFSSHLTNVGDYAFAGCYALPSADGVYYAGDWAVLRSTVVPSTVALREGTYGIVYALFSGASSLVSITNMDNVSVIPGQAFRGTKLQGISAPACESVEYAAFSYASVMSFAYLPKVKYIPDKTFYNCYALTSLTVDFSNITSVGGFAFCGCSSLSIPFSLPQCSVISNAGFQECGLTKIYAPLCSTYVDGTYNGCFNLSEAYLPNVPKLSWAAFAYCYSLRRIYLSACSYISSNAFSNTTSMSSLYLAGSSVCRIYISISAYWPKSVYVLTSMYDEYVTHSLWASMSSRLVSLTTEQMEEIAATF